MKVFQLRPCRKGVCPLHRSCYILPLRRRSVDVQSRSVRRKERERRRELLAVLGATAMNIMRERAGKQLPAPKILKLAMRD
eukprot:g51874.t1